MPITLKFISSIETNRLGVKCTEQALDIEFLGLKLPDSPQSNIGRYFPLVAKFIEEAVDAGGVVLVNCLMGVS